jgi:hypothetical protein
MYCGTQYNVRILYYKLYIGYVLWYPVQCTVRILYYKLNMICIVIPSTMYCTYFILQVKYDMYCGTQYNVRICIGGFSQTILEVTKFFLN